MNAPDPELPRKKKYSTALKKRNAFISRMKQQMACFQHATVSHHLKGSTVEYVQ